MGSIFRLDFRGFDESPDTLDNSKLCDGEEGFDNVEDLVGISATLSILGKAILGRLVKLTSCSRLGEVCEYFDSNGAASADAYFDSMGGRNPGLTESTSLLLSTAEVKVGLSSLDIPSWPCSADETAFDVWS